MSVGPNHDVVRTAYWLLLGREPESQEVIERHLSNSPDLEALRRRFIGSSEFLRINGRFLLQSLAAREMAIPREAIELRASPADIGRLQSRVARCWAGLAEAEPLYSVLSLPRYRRRPDGSLPDSDAFYASGEAEATAVAERFARFGLALDGAHFIEYGCGAGRVTAFLAPRVRWLHAFDVAPAYLGLAADLLAARGIGNVSFGRVESPNMPALPAADAVYSRIVLQHNPPPLQAVLVARLLAALRPGGIAILQTITAMAGYRFSIREYLDERPEGDDQELHVLPQHALFAVVDSLGCELLEVCRDDSVTSIDTVSTRIVARKRRTAQAARP